MFTFLKYFLGPMISQLEINFKGRIRDTNTKISKMPNRALTAKVRK